MSRKEVLFQYYYEHIRHNIVNFLKWLVLAVLTGLIVGGASGIFAKCIGAATAYRDAHIRIFLLLPFAGLLIVFLYQKLGSQDGGTNQVLATIKSKDKIPFISAPLIFLSTLLTHLTGGSAGREGASIQFGGSLGSWLGKLAKLDEFDQHVMIMCGMSAAFAAVFGTPMAAAVFAMEVASVGVMYYAALFPCMIASIIASRFADGMGVNPETFLVVKVPELTIANGLKIGLVAVGCSFLSILFCILLKYTSKFYQKYLKNPYLRVFAAACIIIAVTALLNTRDYMGAGGNLITRAIEEEMQKVKEAFVSCAVRVKNAGFDAVMIHCAHGVNLLSAFMSPIYNHRTDEYGGSLENRIRYPLEILKAVREAVGVSMIIECRVSGSERLSGCPSLEDTCAFLKRAQEYVDLVNVSGGALKSEAEAYSLPSYHMPHMLNVKYAGQIKKHIGIPVAVVGNITTMEEAEQILAEGKADVICMARNMLADPDFIKKAYRNQAESIRPCVRCFECGMAPAWGGIVRCAVNPQCGKEIKYGRIFRADEVKKVMIAGAGPAGMMAAQTCARRGHEVVLYEREEKLGGRLYEVSAMDCKDGYKRYVRWMIQETMSCGVKIVTGKEVTPQIVESENPDVLMIAVGADILTPPIEGIHLPNVVKVDDVDLNKAETGQKVVVCGAGLSGAECGVQLAKDGKQVTLIDFKSAEQLAFSGNFLVRAGLNILIKQYKVEEIYEAKIQKITEKGLYYKDQAGETKFLEADTIVSAFGMRSRTKTVDMLKELVPETYVIGDAEKVGNVMKANRQAFEISVEI